MQTNDDPNKMKQKNLNHDLFLIFGQVGCFSILIILGFLLGGLWLDNHYLTNTKYTLIFLLASIPVSIGVILFVSLKGAKKLQNQTTRSNTIKKEENDIGTKADT